MTDNRYRQSDETLATLPTIFRGGLLAGRVVVVSGGGSGIGRATAWLAARLGATVVICGRTIEKLDQVTAAVRQHGLLCDAKSLDIRERPSVDRFFSTLAEDYGCIDILINCAGGQFAQEAIELSEKGWQAVINTNLNGTFNMMQAAARHWQSAKRGGGIVTVVVSPRGLHQVAHTVAARAGIVGFTEAVAVEWAPQKIRVNCIAPGAIESEGWAVYGEDVPTRYPQSNPLRQAGTAWDVAQACLYLAGPGGAFITGHTLEVSGGGNLWGEVWTAGKPEYFVEASRAWEPTPPKR